MSDNVEDILMRVADELNIQYNDIVAVLNEVSTEVRLLKEETKKIKSGIVNLKRLIDRNNINKSIGI